MTQHERRRPQTERSDGADPTEPATALADIPSTRDESKEDGEIGSASPDRSPFDLSSFACGMLDSALINWRTAEVVEGFNEGLKLMVEYTVASVRDASGREWALSREIDRVADAFHQRGVNVQSVVVKPKIDVDGRRLVLDLQSVDSIEPAIVRQCLRGIVAEGIRLTEEAIASRERARVEREEKQRLRDEEKMALTNLWRHGVSGRAIRGDRWVLREDPSHAATTDGEPSDPQSEGGARNEESPADEQASGRRRSRLRR